MGGLILGFWGWADLRKLSVCLRQANHINHINQINRTMLKEQLEKLAPVRSNPCITISLNTHRTHPANVQDATVLKNLCTDAENRLLSEFDKRSILPLLEQLKTLHTDVDVNHNLDSLHIFLSEGVREIIRSPWPTMGDRVEIADSFAIRPLIKAVNRTEEYLIMVVSQSGVQLYTATNDAIQAEISNGDFPFKQMSNQETDTEKLSDSKRLDNLVREFLNVVDKALNKVHTETGMRCVIICTEDNHSRLMQVADKPAAYYGYVPINYNNTAKHKIAADAWAMVLSHQEQQKIKAIAEMQEAVSHGKVVTDPQEIFRAAKEGRADLLIVHETFRLPARITGEFTFEAINDATASDATNDITSDIAWEVISKKGRAIFTNQEDIKTLGDMALKVRY